MHNVLVVAMVVMANFNFVRCDNIANGAPSPDDDDDDHQHHDGRWSEERPVFVMKCLINLVLCMYELCNPGPFTQDCATGCWCVPVLVTIGICGEGTCC